MLAIVQPDAAPRGCSGALGRVERVTGNVWIIPGSPALALSRDDEPSQRLLAATRSLAGTADGRPIDIVCSLDGKWHTAHTGSLRAWGGPEVTVRAGNHLGEIVARYALGDPEVREVRPRIGNVDPHAVTVVVVDGPAGLTERAPLALQPGAPETHQGIVRWLDGAEAVVVDTHVLEPQLWRELAALDRKNARLIDADASLGVGRYVAEWSV